jgi:molecular chaperone HtpG
LVDSPAVLVSADGMPGNMQKMMRMLNQDFRSTPKVLELNPAHPLLRDMAALRAADPAHPALKELVEQVFDNCLLMEGIVEHPGRMAARIQSLMTRAAAAEAAKGGK